MPASAPCGVGYAKNSVRKTPIGFKEVKDRIWQARTRLAWAFGFYGLPG